MAASSGVTPKTDNQLRLRDGRFLGYAEYGDPNGAPVFFFHGVPFSRLGGALCCAAAVRQHVRVISTDRPGYGLSTFQPKRTFLDWPADVTQLADSLDIDRFAVAGFSGGGPYVAVCALRIPQRLTHAVMISGIGPFDVPGATEGMSAAPRKNSSCTRARGASASKTSPCPSRSGMATPTSTCGSPWAATRPRRSPTATRASFRAKATG